ncbi:unnamed protein product [Caenorhabditis brenneri]
MHMSWICPGYYFFPFIAGYNTGWEIITPHMSMTLYVLILAFELPSMLLCFVFRNMAARQFNQGGPRKMYMEKLWIFFAHVVPFALAYGMWRSNLTYDQKYEFVKENWPQCLPWMRQSAFEVYDYKLNPWLTVTGYTSFLGIQTLTILQKYRRTMSRQTYQMHRTALISLVLQLLMPGIVLVVPFFICLTVVVTEAIGLQELATDTMFLVGSHSMCSCTVMIFSNPRYRKFLKEKLVKSFGLMKLTNPATTVEPSRVANSIAVVKN